MFGRIQVRFRILLCCAIVFVLWYSPAPAQQRSQRLVLKEGGYQSVVKYELQGDHVHYLSAERYEWEDIPASLIDWEATKKYNEELSSGKYRIRVGETPEEKEEREKEEANSPEIAAGLRLPGTGGVFLFDEFQGKPELAEIVQNGSDVNKSSSKNVLRSAINPLGGSKHAFELKGEHAQIQSHQRRPIVYVDIDEGPQPDQTLTDRFRIVRATSKNGVRVVGNVKLSLTGKISEETSTAVPVNIEKQGTGAWLKLIPSHDLPPGEYAIVEMLGPQEMNLYVWDFGVNPSAPANPNVWRPAVGKGPGT